MDYKKYTEDKYVPISEISGLGKEFIEKVKKYRSIYAQIVEIDNLNFAKLIETPQLLKKRYIKNVEIKNQFNINSDDNDYILEIAKSFILNKLIPDIKIKDSERLRELYKKNDNDLTIITNYLSNNIRGSLIRGPNIDIEKILPELSKKEIQFITKCNVMNLAYSLKDFIQVNKSSYETARKSLEKLKILNLYTKEKISKQFIYRPTKKLMRLTKGGV